MTAARCSLLLALLLLLIAAPAAPAAGQPDDPDPAPRELTIVNQERLPSGAIDQPYSTTLVAFGGTAPYLGWVVETGELPPGLTLDPSTGELAGTPTAAGHYTFMVGVRDSAGDKAFQTMQLRVDGDPFQLRELPAPVFDGVVRPDAEYPGSAPFRFELVNGQPVQVHLRQSGGVLHIGAIVHEPYLTENAIRICLAPHDVTRSHAFVFNPFNPANPTGHEKSLMLKRPGPGNRGNRWLEQQVRGFVGKANSIQRQSWHAELKINLSEAHIRPGNTDEPLLISICVISGDRRQSFWPTDPAALPQPRRPHRDGDDEGDDDRGGHPDTPPVFLQRAFYRELHSTDRWGRENADTVVDSDAVRGATGERQMIHTLVHEPSFELAGIDRQLESLRSQWDRAYAEDPARAQRVEPDFRAELDRVHAEMVEAREKWIEMVKVAVNVNRNYYTLAWEVARRFSLAADARTDDGAAELWTRALRFAEMCRILNPYFVPARMIRGRALYRLGRLERALDVFAVLAMEQPDDPSIVLEVARLHLELADRETARAEVLAAEVATVDARIAGLQRELATAQEQGDTDAIAALEGEIAELEGARAGHDATRRQAQAGASMHLDEARLNLDGVASEHAQDGTVPLACAALAFQYDRADMATAWLTLAQIAARQPDRFGLALELVAFYGARGEYDRMQAVATDLASVHGSAASYHYSVASTFVQLNQRDRALPWYLAARRRLREASEGIGTTAAEKAYRFQVERDAMVALADAGQFERARSAYVTMRALFTDASDSLRQQINRYADLDGYAAFWTDEQQRRDEAAELAGTPRANPRVRLVFTAPDGSDAGEATIEVFRNSSPGVAAYLLDRIRAGRYEPTGDPSHGGAWVAVAPSGAQAVVGVGALDPDEPLTGEQSTRRHFRGSVSLMPVQSGRFGPAFGIDTSTCPWLNGVCPVVGRVISGMDVVDALRPGTRVEVRVVGE